MASSDHCYGYYRKKIGDKEHKLAEDAKLSNCVLKNREICACHSLTISSSKQLELQEDVLTQPKKLFI